MPELHFKNPEFTWGAFNKHRKRIKKFRETHNLKNIVKI